MTDTTETTTPETLTTAQLATRANHALTGGNPRRELSGDYSAECKIGPTDGRCRYWAKVVRAGGRVPMPEDVTGAESLYGDYLPRGAIELFAGEWQIAGEANHHVKQRGWTWRLYRVTPAGWTNPDGTVDAEASVSRVSVGGAKDSLRALRDELAGDRKTAAFRERIKALLLGSGEIAAICREIHYRRLLTEIEAAKAIEAFALACNAA